MVKSLSNGEESPLERSGLRSYGPDGMARVDHVQPWSGTGDYVVYGDTSNVDHTDSNLHTPQPAGIVRENSIGLRPHSFLGPCAQLSCVEIRSPSQRHTSDSASGYGYGHLSRNSRQAITQTNTPGDYPASGIIATMSLCYNSKSTDSSDSFSFAPTTPLESWVKQPATRPITEQQFINEVKGIYAGLVMVEKKCVEVVSQQSQSTKKLSDQQWKALVALHRTLLQEHHDFFSASQHPTASVALEQLAVKYAMPARVWRRGIHAFLELLRHRLPDSMEHMLSFIYLSYSMIALLKESVPSFVETWIECLGDLARYGMAIEDSDPRDREIWSNVAKMWYNEAADKSPNVGRIQHHLSVLARPNLIEQLFYHEKALIAVVPFVSARESIMLLFEPFLKNNRGVQSRNSLTEHTFVNAYALLFARRELSKSSWTEHIERFKLSWTEHMERSSARYKMQGPQMAAALFAGLLDFGQEASLWDAVEDMQRHGTGRDIIPHYLELQSHHAKQAQYSESPHPVSRFPSPHAFRWHDIHKQEQVGTACIVKSVALLLPESITSVAQTLGDTNAVPLMHVTLSHLWDLSFAPDASTYIEQTVPWNSIAKFLNTFSRSGVSYANIEADNFPSSHGRHGRQFPEDFLMQGLTVTRHYYSPDFFTWPLIDEDESAVDLISEKVVTEKRNSYFNTTLTPMRLALNKLSRLFAMTQRRKIHRRDWTLLGFALRY